jgi:putative ABC transport system permease protein
VEAVRSVLPATANPANPNEVRVSRPSDALAARAAANSAFTSLLLGLGAVALLVGGVGIANVMVISVLERRSEIGLRRGPGRDQGPRRPPVPGRVAAAGPGRRARRGGPGGGGHRRLRRRPRLVGGRPRPAMAGGILAALAIGAVAGLYPALRAAGLAPTDALRTV